MESCVHKPTDGRMTSAYFRTQNKTRPPQRKLKLGREATTGNASAVRRLLFQLLESAGEHLPDLTLRSDATALPQPRPFSTAGVAITSYQYHTSWMKMADALDDEWWLEQDVENRGNFLNKKNQTFIYIKVFSLYLILKFLATRQSGSKKAP